ncbi:protein preY, mitochondrial isoform X1 [Odocoileus virginianus]|uniref:Protein preY, mitochondrial n=1 Tax=Odocoileus virginianus TaxID=9874 RepID=A0ABM4GY31_ODOVR
MLSGVCGRLASALRGTRAPPSAVALRCVHASSSRPSADKSERTEKPPRAFDQALLEFLVCPLSKKPLRQRNRKEKGKLDDLRLAWTVARVNKALVCEEEGGRAEKMSSGGQWQVAFEEILQIPLGGALTQADLQNFQKLL